jgi:hypothetical protein
MSDQTEKVETHGETAQEMLDRLSLIALGERDCDLSDNDSAALEWVLVTRADLLAAVRSIVQWFDALDREQWERTGPPNTFAEASRNWNLPSEVKSFDMTAVKAAIAKAEGRS